MNEKINQRNKSANFRISDRDNKRLLELCEMLEIPKSEIWRRALKELHEKEINRK